MAKNCALYISNRELPSLELIKAQAAGAKVHVSPGEEAGSWRRIVFAWPKVRLTVNHMDASDESLPEHLSGFCGYVRQLVKGEMDAHVWNLIQKILKTKHVLGCEADPAFGQEGQQMIQWLVRTGNAIIFQGSSVFDTRGKIYLGADGSRDDKAQIADLPSALERRRRSEALLHERAIRVLETLPPVVADEEVTLRAPEEVAQRAAALCAVAVRGEGLEQEKAIGILKGAGLWDAASPAEKAFLRDPEPSKQDMIQFCWRYEGLWVMLWALGYVDGLGLPDAICDVPRSAEIMLKVLAKPQAFVDQARLRPAEEILDLLDLTYRCHWVTTDARVNGGEPLPGLEPGVTQERHYALNWLTCIRNEDWDEVNTDT